MPGPGITNIKTATGAPRHAVRLASHLLAFGFAGLVLLFGNQGSATDAAGPGSDPSLRRVIDAGGRIGALNVILTWNTGDDLDLHVICPSGEKIYYIKRNNCGGVLDVDMNANRGTTSTSPVENVTWPIGAAPAGTYKVEVDPYRRDSSQPIEFKVELLIDGQQKEAYSRHFDAPGKMSVFEFTLPYTGRRQQ